MWELFLSTYVQEKDFDQARAVLQGLCAMSAHPVWRRVLFFTSSPQNTGLPSVKRLPAAHPQRPWWLELDGHLRRTQFNFQVRYELGINGPTDFGDHFAQSADDLARGLRYVSWLEGDVPE